MKVRLAPVVVLVITTSPLLAGVPAGNPVNPPDGWLSSVQADIRKAEYEVTWQDSTVLPDVAAAWHAPNRAHDLRTYFTPQGIRVVRRTEETPTWQSGLELVRMGRGGGLQPVQPGELHADGQRVEYRRGELVEWYVNDERGLEQGFTIARDAGGEGELVLEMAVLGDLVPSLVDDGQALELVTPGGVQVLRYGELYAYDAQGLSLPTRMRLSGCGRQGLGECSLELLVNVDGAAFPVTVDPLTTTPSWTAESDQANARFGYSVASAGDVNGDGFGDVIVGAHYYDNGEASEGQAFVYHGSASGLSASPAWTADGDQASALFGESVASAGDVNGDGFGDVVVGCSSYDNGEIDEGRAFVYLGSASGLATSAAWTAESDQQSAHFGSSVAAAGDVNGDGYTDVVVGADNFSNGETNEGRAFVYLGSASGPVASAAWTAEGDQVGAAFGYSVASAGDVDADGYDDVIVGARYDDNGENNEGRAFVYLGSASGLAAGPSWTAESNQANAYLGTSVASAGDVNGDGYGDIIVGADFYDNGEADEGRAFVYLGSASGPAAGPAWTAESDQEDAYFGTSVASAGDVNGDGYGDVIVGAHYYDGGESDEGGAFVFHGSGAGLETDAAWTAESDQASSQFGVAVASAGDVNGDGFGDVIVGAQWYDNDETQEGRAFVYHGSGGGLTESAEWTAESNQSSAFFGISVASAGDVNGDGFADVIVGAHNYDNGDTDEGRAFVFHGSIAGLDATAAWTAEGNQAYARLGCSVASAGDVNGDGFGDVIVGAYQYDDDQADEGRAHVFHGSAAGLATSPAWTADGNQGSAFFGYSVASAGDVNGDGFSDAIVGAPVYDKGETDEGGAFVYSGSAAGLATTATWTADSNQANAFFGISVASAGDVNGDGFSDVIVGAQNYDNGDSNEGRTSVFHGSTAGLESTAAWTAESNQAYANFGSSAASAGDVNGDGFGDVIVGAQNYDNGDSNEGRASVFHGSTAGLESTAAWTAESNQADSNFGNSVASAGDVNGDGFGDVVVGAHLFDDPEADEGRAFVYHGSAAGLAASAAWTAESDQEYASFGSSVASAGDVNGDGFGDVIVGASEYQDGSINEGGAFLYLGGDGAGRLVRAQQLRGGGSSTVVQPWGSGDDPDDFQVRLNAHSPFGRAQVKVEAEACPSGAAFGDAGCVTVESAEADSTASADGVQVTVTVPGLDNGSLYHWRARTWYEHDGTWQHGPWRRLNGQAVEADIRVAADVDGDGIAPPHDCDEGDATVYPGAPELCDLKDNDCDGSADEPESFAGAVSATAVTEASCGVRVSWDDTTACDGEPVFAVYRSETSGFEPNGTTLVEPCVAQTFYVDSGVAADTTYYYVVRAENPSTGGAGPCYGGGQDDNLVEVSATTPAGCDTPATDVDYLTARASDSQVLLEWSSPTTGSVQVCVRTDGWPTGPGDGACEDVPETFEAYGSLVHDTGSFGGIANGQLYYYGAFVNALANGTGAWSDGKFTAARPFADSDSPWAYSTGATTLAPAGILPGVATYTASNDRALHGMAAGASGGMWPGGWAPGAMNAPAQWRPIVVDFGAPTIGGASTVAFAGCQDGRLYAFDGDTGDRLWQSPPPPVLGDAVQASPAGVLTAFGGPFDLLLVGTRNPSGGSALVAIDPADGQEVWRFDNSPDGEIGIISSQPYVSASQQRVWFTSRRHPTGSQDTVWCLDFDQTGATKVWSRGLWDVDTAPNVRDGVLYAGNTTGQILVLDAATGDDRWPMGMAVLSAVKTTIWTGPSPGGTAMVFSTDLRVRAMEDTGTGTGSWGWSVSLPNPSAPVVAGGSVYVGTTRNNGELVRLDLDTGAELGAVGLGDPNVAKTPGRPSFDGSTSQVLIGCENGVVYAVDAGF